MCLFPRLIRNKKYVPNKKNGYTQLTPSDERILYVPIGCGNCIECRRQKANQWRTRLHEEFKSSKQKAYFVTLSISDENFDKIIQDIKTNATNAIAKILVRRFLERWRKKYQFSIKHWFITELGEEHDRLHLHGFIFTNVNLHEELANIWSYGNVYIGDYCNEKTINYCVKYCLKIDEKHKDYKSIILCSPGLGKEYVNKMNIAHRFNGTETKETYRLNDGQEIGLPIYYRNHFFTENEREQLWLQKLDEHKRYVRGIEIDISTEKGLQRYERVLKAQQELNNALGYGNDSKEWKKKEYNITLRTLNANSKYQNARKTD